MRIFITGASGWIGSAATAELLEAGHEVVGLARTDAAAEAIVAAGAIAHRGSLDDLDSLAAGAEAADGVIHLGFNHDFSDMAGAGRTERAAVTVLGDTLAGSDRPFLFASGLAFLAPGRIATEDDHSLMNGPDAPRGGGSNLALSYSEKGVRTVALRFPPTVHGEGDHGFMAELVRVARATGSSAYIGDGTNRWPAVHRNDAAHLVRLALDHGPAGSVVHATGEEGVAARDIAAAIGSELDLPISSVAAEDAAAHFGWIGAFFATDMPASSALTRERYNWTPTHPTLIEDLEAGRYTRS